MYTRKQNRRGQAATIELEIRGHVLPERLRKNRDRGVKLCTTHHSSLNGDRHQFKEAGKVIVSRKLRSSNRHT